MYRGLKLALVFLTTYVTFSQANAGMPQQCSNMGGFEVTIGEPVLTILDLELLEPAVFRCQLP